MQELTEDYTGEYIEDTDTGKLVVNYVNGKKEGITKFINKNNNMVICEVEYSNDIISGVTKQYFPSGVLLSMTNYENGIQNGEFVVFYESGVKQLEAFYKNGEFEGKFIIYDEFGDEMSECVYKNGQKHGKSITYYPKTSGGQVSEISEYKHGLIDGDKIMFYPTGEILSVTPYVEGRPQAYTKTYDKNGNSIV